MELDDLKSSWKKTPEKEIITSQVKIMELIQNKSYGPTASLKAVLSKQLLAVPVVSGILIWKAVSKPELQSDPFFILFIVLALGMAISFGMAYSIVVKINSSGAEVKTNLRWQIRSLQRILLCYRVLAFAAVVLMAVFLEMFSDRGTALLIPEWYEIAIGLRVLGYAVMMLFAFLAARTAFNHQFGTHLLNLKGLIQDLENERV
jgi:hypothetical protein